MDPRTLHGSTAIRAISVFLGIVYLLAGGFKLAGAEMMVESFRGWGYSVGFMYLVGVLEVAGAAMILTTRARFFGATLLFVLMVGAALTHINAGEWMLLPAPVVMMVLSGLVAWTERVAAGPREIHA